MRLQTICSAKRIERQFRTGEEPVLVMCSDIKTYVCKYMRSSASAYKLACELIGARMAKAWKLRTPDIALVRIKPAHWNGIDISHSLSAPSMGSRWIEGVIDITPSSFAKVPASVDTLYQLMRIALFDFWTANEDRNANNANLMYDVVNYQLVSIDYGCIFNTATFDFPLSQLTPTDTILCSDLFSHLKQRLEKATLQKLSTRLSAEYYHCILQCAKVKEEVVDDVPHEWNLPTTVVSEKICQLFDEKWIADTWNNFMECLNENINYE